MVAGQREQITIKRGQGCRVNGIDHYTTRLVLQGRGYRSLYNEASVAGQREQITICNEGRVAGQRVQITIKRGQGCSVEGIDHIQRGQGCRGRGYRVQISIQRGKVNSVLSKSATYPLPPSPPNIGKAALSTY